jgi:hypothetical protein
MFVVIFNPDRHPAGISAGHSPQLMRGIRILEVVDQ